MANQDPEQINLIKEIDEELRQENFAKLWKLYGNYLIIAAVLFVVSVAAYQGWKAYDLNKRAEDSSLYNLATKAFIQDKPDKASSALIRLAKEGTKGYSTLARLSQAGLKARSGDAPGAGAAYLSIANDPSVDEIFRDLALVLSTMHDLDKGDTAELIQRIRRLTASSNPWRHSAKEFAALLAHRNGERQQADQLFKELADDVTAPADIRARATELAASSGN